MSYTRIVNRRGTTTQWQDANPILATGEIGFDTTLGQFKIGDGSSNWSALEYFADFDYISNAIKTDLIDNAPTALDTLNELAAALGDDENFSTSVTNLIGTKAPLNSPTFTGTVDFSSATVSGVMLPINWLGAYDSNTTYVENDMVQYNGSVYYATGPDINGTFVPGSGDWELFAAKGETGATGAAGDTGPTGPQGPTGDFSLAQTVSSITSNYSIQSSDAGKILTPNSSSAIVLTVNSSTAFSVGQSVDIYARGSGSVTVSGSGVTLEGKGTTASTFYVTSRYEAASIICVASNVYAVVGAVSP